MYSSVLSVKENQYVCPWDIQVQRNVRQGLQWSTESILVWWDCGQDIIFVFALILYHLVFKLDFLFYLN